MKELTEQEFLELKQAYFEENNKYEKSMIFHVGIMAGFFSEVVSMMECMCYCHLNHIRFVLYADDANFSYHGWNDLFDSFGEENHDILNSTGNLRYVPERIDRKLRYQYAKNKLKKRNGIDYVTSDCFLDIISPEMKKTHIDWKLFGMNGTVYPEISKLFPFATRLNQETRKNVDEYKKKIALPGHYTSIQIRGGDKVTERDKLVGAEECLKLMRESGQIIKDLFVFTDDYRNVDYLKKNTDWNIYTLAKEEERGYVNEEFQKREWKQRYQGTIKLFAMVELCIDSDFHFGYEAACVNNYIKVCKTKNSYFPIYDEMELRERQVN